MGRELLDLDFPAGQGGINRTKNLALLPLTDLSYAESVTVERDVIEKVPGAVRIHPNPAVAGYQMTGLWEFVSAIPLTVELVAYLDNGQIAGLVVVDFNGVAKTLKNNLTTGGFPWFADGWDGTTKALYIWNGKNPIQVYLGGTAGVATADIPNPSTDWTVGNPEHQPKAGVAHNSRMVSWGNWNFPHNLYLSVPGEHGNYVGGESAVQRIYPGEGYGITAAVSWRQRLYIGKFPRGIYILDDTDASIANWEQPKLTEAIGVRGPGCFLSIVNDVLILGADGYFYALSQIQTQGEVDIPPLLPLQTSQWIKEQLNLSMLHKTRSIWFGHKSQAWFAVPSVNSQVCNMILIVDMHDPSSPKLLSTRRDICLGLALRRETADGVARPAFGDELGIAWQGDQTARDKGGAGYVAQYETPPGALYPAGIQRGNLEEMLITMSPLGNWDVTIEVERDGQVGQTLAFSMNTPGAPVGSLSLDSDVFAGQTIANVRRRLEGDAHYVKLIGKNANAGESFCVMNHRIRYTEGSDKP